MRKLPLTLEDLAVESFLVDTIDTNYAIAYESADGCTVDCDANRGGDG